MSNNYFGLAKRTQLGAINTEVLTGRGKRSNLFGDNHKFMHDDWNIWLKYIIPELGLSEFSENNVCLP
jgi:hypothetical protein